jgi:hypothetical protein
VQLLRPILNKLAGSRASNLRSAYLCLVWDQVPTGWKKGLFARRGADSFPLCGLPYLLNRIVLRCPALLNRRKEIWDDVMRRYEFGVIPAAGFPTACTEQVRAYVRVYFTLRRLTPLLRLRTATLSLCECLTPVQDSQSFRDPTLLCLHVHPRAQISPEDVYFRPSQAPPRCPLPLATALLEAFPPASGYSFITFTRLSPHSGQLPISSFMSPGPWLSSYDSDVSDDKDDDDMTPADSATVAAGDVSVCSSYADDPNLAHFVSVADLQRSPGVPQWTFPCSVWGRLRGVRASRRTERLACRYLPPPSARFLLQLRAGLSRTPALTWATPLIFR